MVIAMNYVKCQNTQGIVLILQVATVIIHKVRREGQGVQAQLDS